MNHQELADVINQEGIGYAIQDYLSAERIDDPKLRDAWMRAKQAMDEICTVLGDLLE